MSLPPLPPLPTRPGVEFGSYSSDQMLAYGALCRKMALDGAADICDEQADIAAFSKAAQHPETGDDFYDNKMLDALTKMADGCAETIRALK